ncbi:hypothetical protein [Gluconacetobacter tumulisoli]|uniref:Uncharacterized protein n=1 Tax=Gluconacetobacter tumulisoli TaxID=1286189 RepID=A0A7W4PK61_9PROT|nr:hypothetical protein [Gluconacetobacter tumulisoli]MBB2200483.1 hypothetical protein [Gluconacetobacter tumulisoli]
MQEGSGIPLKALRSGNQPRAADRAEGDVSHNTRAFPEDGYGTNASASPWTASQTTFQQGLTTNFSIYSLFNRTCVATTGATLSQNSAVYD